MKRITIKLDPSHVRMIYRPDDGVYQCRMTREIVKDIGLINAVRGMLDICKAMHKAGKVPLALVVDKIPSHAVKVGSSLGNKVRARDKREQAMLL